MGKKKYKKGSGATNIDNIVEKTTHKTMHQDTVAKTPKEVVDNIL